ncbi:unnamed protein product, partial [Phaeothamnion confervicola]
AGGRLADEIFQEDRRCTLQMLNSERESAEILAMAQRQRSEQNGACANGGDKSGRKRVATAPRAAILTSLMEAPEAEAGTLASTLTKATTAAPAAVAAAAVVAVASAS